MALLVRSVEPCPSWGELVPLEILSRKRNPTMSLDTNNDSKTWDGEPPLPPGAEAHGTENVGRPTPVAAPSSGPLGPGAYTLNEGQTRPTAVCRTWGRSERFSTIIKDSEAPRIVEPRRPTDHTQSACQSMKPIRDKRVKLGRPSSLSSLPTIRDAYKFAVHDRVMVSSTLPPSRPEPPRERRRLSGSEDDIYKVPGKMGKSEGKLVLRSEFPRPGAGVSSICGVDDGARHRLFVGAGASPME